MVAFYFNDFFLFLVFLLFSNFAISRNSMIRLKYVHFCTLDTHTRTLGIHTHTERERCTHKRWIFLFYFYWILFISNYAQKNVKSILFFCFCFPFSERNRLVGWSFAWSFGVYRKIKMVVHPEKNVLLRSNLMRRYCCWVSLCLFLSLAHFISIRSAKNSKWNFYKTLNKHGRCRV